MLSVASVLRRFVALAMSSIVASVLTARAEGQTVDVALNVRYTTPGDMSSGGTWRLVARSSVNTFGISAMQINLSMSSISGTPHAAGPIGVVNGNHDAGFSIFEDQIVNNNHVLIISQLGRSGTLTGGQEQTLFYGVGTLANGAPNFPGKPVGTNSIGPAFATLTQTERIPWATALDSLGEAEWSTAAGLATGSFAAGSMPELLGGSANVFTSLPVNNQSLAPTTTVSGASFILHPLRIVQGVPGDYSGNGVVDAADYTVWRDHLGQMFQLMNEGPDTPGEVTAADYTFWKTHFGTPGAGGGSASAGVVGASAAAVPEPGLITLWLGAAGMSFFRPKRRVFRNFGRV
jgi:hypothetical protein